MRKPILAVAIVVAASAATTLPIAAGATATTATEHFSFIDTSATDATPNYSVIATGAFTDGGSARQKHKGVLVLRLANGTITFDVVNQHKKVSMSQSATACMQTTTGTGKYTIAGGTGLYKGITGSGRSRNHTTFIERARNGTCANAFAAAQSVVAASGPASLS